MEPKPLDNQLPPEFDKKQVKAAIDALHTYLTEKASNDQLGLLDEKHKINMQLTFKKVPHIKNKIIRISLPHSITQDNADVCLFVKDLDKSERDYAPTVQHYQDLLRNKGITCVSQVVPMKAVKTEYQPYEAKRNLSNMYEVFLADERIVRLLPGFLGKNFYGRKRVPLSINVNATDLQKEFTQALNTTQCVLGGVGSTCQVTVTHTGLKQTQSIENVVASLQKLCADIPGGASNVRSIYIKTVDSPALPIYVNTDGAEKVEIPAPKPQPAPREPEECTTVMEGMVRVSRRGNVTVIPDDDGSEQKTETDEDKKEKKNKKKAAKAKKAQDKKTAEKQPPQKKKKQKKVEVEEEEAAVSSDEEAEEEEPEVKPKLGKRKSGGKPAAESQFVKRVKAKEIAKSKPKAKQLTKKTKQK